VNFGCGVRSRRCCRLSSVVNSARRSARRHAAARHRRGRFRSRSRNVSRMNRSDRRRRRAPAPCSRKYSRASSTPVLPHGLDADCQAAIAPPHTPLSRRRAAQSSAACSFDACSLSPGRTSRALMRFRRRVRLSVGAGEERIPGAPPPRPMGWVTFARRRLLLMRCPSHRASSHAPSHTRTRSSIVLQKRLQHWDIAVIW